LACSNCQHVGFSNPIRNRRASLGLFPEKWPCESISTRSKNNVPLCYLGRAVSHTFVCRRGSNSCIQVVASHEISNLANDMPMPCLEVDSYLHENELSGCRRRSESVNDEAQMVRLTAYLWAVSATRCLRSCAPTFSGTGFHAPENVCHNSPLLKLFGNPVLILVTIDESVRVGTSSGKDFLNDVGLGVCIVLDVCPLA